MILSESLPRLIRAISSRRLFIAWSEMTKPEGYCGYSRPMWMFIQSYEKLREYLYSNATIETLIQFEYSAFEEATVPVCTFAFKNSHVNPKRAAICALWISAVVWKYTATEKTLEAIANHDCGFYYEQNTDNFSKIPGSPVAYWASDSLQNVFKINYFTIILYHQVKM